MADSSGDQSWTTQTFRQSIRGKIEEAIRQSGNPTTKSVVEMENHVFAKARSREEYLGYVARLIIHAREMNSKKPPLSSGQATSTTALAPGASPSNPGVQVSDPMSALRNLAGQGTTGAITVQQGGQPQLGTPVLGTNTIPVASQAQVQAMSQGGIVSAPAPAPNVVATSLGQPGVAPIMMQPTRFLSQVGNIITTQPQRPQLLHNVPLQLHRSRQQTAQQQSQSSNVPNQSVPLQQLMGGFNESMSFVQTQQTSPATSQYQSTTQFQGQSPGPVVTNQGPGSNQSTVPSPVPQHGTNVSNSQMAPSPAGYAPSPTSQVAPSPVGYSGRVPANAGAPSPGSALNTGNIGTSPSPAGRTPQDDQLYLEKLKQLSKYIEPLRRMIARIDKDEDRKKELSKMKNLLDILSDPNKRCSMEILLKCEQVLERLELRVAGSESSTSAPNQPIVGPSKPPEQNICQPLIDAINYHIKSPLFNHTLQRTFGPAVAALNGPRTVIPNPLSKKRKHEEDNSEISNVLQGEIARLDQRFKIQLDPVQHQGSRTVHLICQLDDKNLPCVPPITIAVPENYPDKPPHCNTTKEEYDSTPFLQCIQKVLSSQLSNMPGKFSVTSLLDAWEMSVRQACSPKPSTVFIEPISSK